MIEQISNITNKVHFNDNATLQGIEGWYSRNEKTNTIYIWFEGTNHKVFNPFQYDSDWIDNFTYYKKKLSSNYYVHGGYYDEFIILKPFIMSLISSYSRVVISGHSAGCFPATMLLATVANEFPDKAVRGRLFGSPRVLGIFSAIKFNRKHLNIVRYLTKESWLCDPIKFVPFSWLWFKHIGLKKVLKKEKAERHKNIFQKIFYIHTQLYDELIR